METNGYVTVSYPSRFNFRVELTHDLELNGHHAEVEDLHRRPEHKVGLERGQVDVLELAVKRTFTAAFGNGHEGKKAHETWKNAISYCWALCIFVGQQQSLPTGAKMN